MSEASIRQLIRDAGTELAAITDVPRLEAELLLAHCLKKPRSYLYAWPERTPEAGQIQQFQAQVKARRLGQPVAYLLGEREFMSLCFQVSPATLIPRPETELLVEQSLLRLPEQEAVKVLELGTGSGAIALAMAHARPDVLITATDISVSALDMAQRNAGLLGTSNVRFLHSDWFSALLPGARFALIVSNPPYIADHDPHLEQGDLCFEPRTALVSGTDGLDAIRTIVSQAGQYLTPGGWLLFEHGASQGAACCKLLQQAGFRQVDCISDAAGLDRISLGQHFPETDLSTTPR
ncbi:MAG: peptide chain release factor N(5)-glutamine methyltransferase [Thiothrix sp.]|nr:peptide chain release factor N(5)-glutamine methyltransferase [Thiothrix sp.]HPE59312.1 peptide chain release factor N(5)-glutamine methyltransferase [Thiolinea sp.]